MKNVRSLVLALALATAGPLAVWSTDAVAADVFAVDELVRFVPAGSLVGDGSMVDLYVVALQKDGTPLTGLALRASAPSGSVGLWTEVGNGLYKIPYTAVSGSTESQVIVSARGKSPVSKKTVVVNGTFTILPKPVEVAAKATPAELTLGRDPEASLTIVGPGKAGMLVAASTGTVETITAMPGGAFTARFVTPKVNFPQNAILAFADAADPTRHGFAVIPLSGAVDYPITAPAGSTVLLEIGDRKYGPVVADAEGKAKIPVQVPPGMSKATQVVVNNGQESRSEIDLRIPETRRIQLFPLPKSLPGDPSIAVPVRVAVVQPTGKPDIEAKPTFTVSAGTIGAAKHLGDGVFEAEWRIPADNGSAKVEVSLGNEVQKDAAEVDLVQRRPSKLALTPTPAQIDGGTSMVTLGVVVTDAAGAPLPATSLQLDLEGGERSGEILALANGGFQVTLQPLGDGPLRLQAWASTEVSANPARGAVLVPERPTVVNDGSSRLDVLVASVDAWGVPVPNTKVALELIDAGGGSLAAKEITTGADGIGRVTYTAGAEAGIVGIRAIAGNVAGATTILQVPAGVAPIAIPAVGMERTVAAMRSWTDASPSLTVARTGGGAVAAVPVPVPTVPVAVRPPAGKLQMVADPTAAKPGGEVKITVSNLAADGTNKGGATPELKASIGSLGPPWANADGSWLVTLSVPADAAGPIEITGTGDGSSGALTIALEGAAVAGSPWDTAAPAPAPVEPAPAPVEPAPTTTDAVADASTATVQPMPKPEKTPSTPGEFRWLRVRGSGVGSTYRYEQAPSEAPGPLIPSRLAVGGPDGGSPASPIGGEVDVRAWGDAVDVPYVGLHTQFRGAAYGIEASAFTGVASDVLLNVEVDVLGRVPFEVASDLYWVGAKAGFHYNDFLMFTGCLDPGCTVNFDPVGIPGLGLGVELGAEVQKAHLLAGYTLGLASGSQPYANAVDVNVGYEFVDHLFGDLGFSMLTRSVVLQGEDSGLDRGELSDSHMMLKLGLGLAL